MTSIPSGVGFVDHALSLPLCSLWFGTELACLRHLRELKADGNKITSTDGLQRMDGLVKLSLQGNCIKTIDLGEYHWCVCPSKPTL